MPLVDGELDPSRAGTVFDLNVTRADA